MKGFLQEYGIIMVVVAVVLGMLTFGKTGYAKGIQDAILGSADHIVETGENIVPKPVKASDTINIEGTEHVVLEQKENNQALVMTANSIGDRVFQLNVDDYTDLRPDGQNANTYENSTIDNYLENEWYNSLSSTMKTAIQSTNIKQFSYYNPSQVYNTISRHVFLSSVGEVGKIVDLNNKDKIKAFSNIKLWTRDGFGYNKISAMILNPAANSNVDDNTVYTYNGIRPAFVIDLSKVDYKVTGHVDYK